MSLVITYIGRKPLVRVARLAGQYAKPRSSPTETLPDGSVVTAFRGDNVNSFDTSSRRADPNRMLQAYFHSAATLNYTRALLAGGFASLRNPQQWNFDYVKDPTLQQEYSSVVDRILDSLNFFDTIGATSENSLSGVNFYTSHEGLLLYYEEALTRRMYEHENMTYIPTAVGSGHGTGKYYNVGSHMLWIGDRTRQLDGAHIEYFSGISNPIGLKVGPTTDPEELVEVVRRLNPGNEAGRINLITRFGAGKVADLLPVQLYAIKKSNLSVVWSCDPMHGNTKLSGSLKTRLVSEISDEVTQSFAAHRTAGTVLGGVHLEMTGENVTECLGGSQQLESHELHTSYETYCDPRLNYTQSLDMAFLVAKQLQPSKPL